MARPEYDTTVGAKCLFGWDGTELLPIFVDLDGQIVITSDDPTFKYKVTDLDTSETTKYFGYTDKDGNWYIMQLTSTTGRYIKGSSGYTTSWTGRTGLSYDYFYIIF